MLHPLMRIWVSPPVATQSSVAVHGHVHASEAYVLSTPPTFPTPGPRSTHLLGQLCVLVPRRAPRGAGPRPKHPGRADLGGKAGAGDHWPVGQGQGTRHVPRPRGPVPSTHVGRVQGPGCAWCERPQGRLWLLAWSPRNRRWPGWGAWAPAPRLHLEQHEVRGIHTPRPPRMRVGRGCGLRGGCAQVSPGPPCGAHGSGHWAGRGEPGEDETGVQASGPGRVVTCRGGSPRRVWAGLGHPPPCGQQTLHSRPPPPGPAPPHRVPRSRSAPPPQGQPQPGSSGHRGAVALAPLGETRTSSHPAGPSQGQGPGTASLLAAATCTPSSHPSGQPGPRRCRRARPL